MSAVDAQGIAARLAEVRARIAGAARKAGRAPDLVRLVAVSKTHPPEAVLAAAAAGQRLFGENYAQDLAAKAAAVNAAGRGAGGRPAGAIAWHFIGNLQTNKAKLVAGVAAMVESVDRVELAEALVRRTPPALLPVRALVQVNVGGEAQKSGVDPGALPALLDALRAVQGLSVEGLMTVPPHTDDPEGARPFFARLRTLAEASALRELSMGMSHDFEIAVAEGATLVRVGTAIFGVRETLEKV